MKLDIKKLSDELGLNYEIEEETKTIRCTYCGYCILRYNPKIKAIQPFDDIFYKTKIDSEKGVFCFSVNINRVYNDDYNYNFLKNELIKTINKFKLEKIEKRKTELCKDFLTCENR